MLTTRQGIRVLGESDLAEFLELTDQDPVVNVFADHRARLTNLAPRWLGGEVWGRFSDGRLTSACHVGANLVPVQCSPRDAAAFGARARSRARTATTIVGPNDAVAVLWEQLAPVWDRPREVRWAQPHLEIDRAPAVPPDPLVRRSVRSDFGSVYPACVAMYTEEVGVSPESGGGGDFYRARVHQLIGRGWSFARFEHGRVIFKAEVSSVSPAAAQIQGVWVAPEVRGQGVAAAGMAAVVAAVRAEIAPVVSLYVNEWNLPARRVYERVGFVETARFATIMW